MQPMRAKATARARSTGPISGRRASFGCDWRFAGGGRGRDGAVLLAPPRISTNERLGERVTTMTLSSYLKTGALPRKGGALDAWCARPSGNQVGASVVAPRVPPHV